MPDLSVIVPARNAAGSIRRTLDALARQDLDGDYEVVVVDDCSDDDTAAVATRAGAAVVRLPENMGAAAARNAGVAVAKAPLLAFTDSDCEPDAGWLRAGLRALRDADLVQGAVEPEREPGPWDRTLTVRRPSGLWESANLFVRREAFDAAGGFRPFVASADGSRERLRGSLPRLGETPFGEDAWFGWRVARTGARTGFAPDALVTHEVKPRPFTAALREVGRRRHFPALVRVAPELRTSFLFARVFLSRRTAAFDLAIASVAAAALLRRPVLLTGAVPYALTAAPSGPDAARPGAWLVAAGRATEDVITSAALISGSLPARAVVL